MIQTLLKSCKPDYDTAAFEATLHKQAATLKHSGDEDGDRPEGVEVIRVTESNFDQHWTTQENIKAEARDRYLEKAKAGRLWAIEVDW